MKKVSRPVREPCETMLSRSSGAGLERPKCFDDDDDIVHQDVPIITKQQTKSTVSYSSDDDDEITVPAKAKPTVPMSNNVIDCPFDTPVTMCRFTSGCGLDMPQPPPCPSGEPPQGLPPIKDAKK
eukprot:TRINITY_DN12104_c0_g1_i1.p1 TRINITY_DN12104_c0_g1~~TRINITY_DN12104_c0_g1_i1.p1  ORF type:complete len:125 (-),score=0.41 TRINITY_DN12104_c0_g1_i1:63-437(-)